ncbi:MAG: electron transport complex subunit E, partial [Pseudomonadales bacterium]|nr:electron transport complex subunit E [Pseudomonadales bacterium]
MTFRQAAIERNPAWVQLLGLCPLLAVSNSVVNALGLAFASTFVMAGSALIISLLRTLIPHDVRLPCFMMVIATFTTCAVMLLEAYTFDLYLSIALFVQIIVTNCMILGRLEAFAARQPPRAALADALGTSCGFAIALLVLGSVREIIGAGSLGAGLDSLFGPDAADWGIDFTDEGGGMLVALLPPGAFILAGLLLGLGRGIHEQRQARAHLRETE